MKLLSPNQVAELTGLPYTKALAVIKSLAYIRIDHNCYISEDKLREFLQQDCVVELITTKEDNEL